MGRGDRQAVGPAPKLAAWALDDFFSQLPPEEITEMQRVQDSINPKLGFYTTVYYHDAINGHFYDKYEGLIDGIIYPYTGANSNTEDATQVGPNLDKILAQTEPRGLGVVLLAYTGRYLSAITPPTGRYIADVIDHTRPYLESGGVMGITLYGLPIADGPAMTSYNVARSGRAGSAWRRRSSAAPSRGSTRRPNSGSRSTHGPARTAWSSPTSTSTPTRTPAPASTTPSRC